MASPKPMSRGQQLVQMALNLKRNENRSLPTEKVTPKSKVERWLSRNEGASGMLDKTDMELLPGSLPTESVCLSEGLNAQDPDYIPDSDPDSSSNVIPMQTGDVDSLAEHTSHKPFAWECTPSTEEQADTSQKSHSKDNKKYRKPKRPCPYCEELFCDLTRHLKRQHASEDKVAQAMGLPSIERHKVFDCLRKEGILKYNRKIRGGTSQFMRERQQGTEDLVVCCGCQGFFSKRRIYQHKKKCSVENLKDNENGMFSFVALPSGCEISEEFRVKVVSCFRQDIVGKICQSDLAVLLLGDRLWAKSVKKERRVIMSDMRILGNVIKNMRDMKGCEFKGEDILKRSNFDVLKQCIVKMTTSDTGDMKAGLKVSLGFVLKKLIKILKGYYVMKDMMKEAAEVDLFSSVLSSMWDFIFYSAQVSCESRRNALRKPADMPLEEDVKILRDYLLTEMNALVQNPYQLWTRHEFIRLRNLICTRITLFNARRGGEPARMLLKDWTDAETSAWIDPQLVDSVTDPLEKSLLDYFKLVYQSGKGSRRLVPVLIPHDTVEPIKKLVELRNSCGVLPNNIYLFPSTGDSMDHVGGWSTTKEVTREINELQRPDLLIADKFRHRASTLFALTEIPEEKRQAFYKHMGHSAQVNRDVYQCPLALNEITQVGKFLKMLDQETPSTSQVQCAVLNTEIPLQASAPADNDDFSDEVDKACEKDSNFTVNRKRKFTPKPKSRRYVQWKDDENELVKKEFKSYIEDNSASGVKGPLPGKTILLEFLKENAILSNFPENQRVDILKTKIFNERKKYRQVCENQLVVV